MSALLVIDALIDELNKFDLDVVIVNFANCDMVGHTAIEPAVVKAVETVDYCVGKLIDWVEANDAIALITADHGNAEKVIDEVGNPFTAHTSNPVPFCITKKGVELRKDGKLSNIAPTIIELLGEKAPKEMDEPSMIISK
jgi:2,3-bisphosphoglycerate-independent phosphoglycerate mutase